jgi:membrane-bound lytic murein transglycosylase B
MQGIGLRGAVLLSLTVVVLNGSARADYASREDVRVYIDGLVEAHNFKEAELVGVFSSAEKKTSILKAIARPVERTLKWYEYRRIFLKEARISQGLEFWSNNESILEQAEEQFGVPPEYVVAIIGVETSYGRNAGSYRVLDALVTLAFDYPPRAKFFRGELTQFLLLAREEGKDPLDLKGSYAGAMGYGQFIPSSFRAYAVDFDGDGVRDIWHNKSDAIGSVANYFSRHGWIDDRPVAFQVEVDGVGADDVANRSLRPDLSVAELQALGVKIDSLGIEDKAALFRMEFEDATEYWLGLNNFYVITRYNHSRLYALAVYQLGQAIKDRREQMAAQL